MQDLFAGLARTLNHATKPEQVFVAVEDAVRRAIGFRLLTVMLAQPEQGVVQRIQQRAARPAENGIRPGGAATVHPDVASMTRAQREALERRVLHGAQIEL